MKSIRAASLAPHRIGAPESVPGEAWNLLCPHKRLDSVDASASRPNRARRGRRGRPGGSRPVSASREEPSLRGASVRRRGFSLSLPPFRAPDMTKTADAPSRPPPPLRSPLTVMPSAAGRCRRPESAPGFASFLSGRCRRRARHLRASPSSHVKFNTEPVNLICSIWFTGEARLNASPASGIARFWSAPSGPHDCAVLNSQETYAEPNPVPSLGWESRELWTARRGRRPATAEPIVADW